ncbi:MAG TPA: hypothetical protein VKV04_22040 [Verrucomicrobiae bacterium]|nr:hypothetical protein [Verrucomicrobiae bacterium]
MINWRPLALAVALVILLPGCSSFYEVHYFKSKNSDPPNFYRLRISGDTLFSSSRYISGYFDEQAVNNYFSEFSQPTNGQFGVCTTNTEQVVPIDGNGNKQGTILLLMLSANSDAIADQIGAIAKTSDAANSIGALLNASAQTGVLQLQSSLQLQQTRAKALAQLGDMTLTNIDINITNAVEMTNDNQSLLSYVNALAGELGNQRPFISFDEAAQWLQNNRTQLLKGSSR